MGEVEARVQLDTERAERQRLQRELSRLREQLVRTDRLASLGTLLGAIAHDLGNIAGSYRLYMEVLEQDVAEQGLSSRQGLLGLAKVGDEIERHAENLSTLCRGQEDGVALLDLRAPIENAVALVRRTRVSAAERVLVQLPEAPLLVEVQGARIEQLVLNLVLNAIDACEGLPADRSVRVMLDAADEGHGHALKIADDGCGIAAEDFLRIFEPSYTTKPPHRGTGLGLFAVAQIAETHGATVQVVSELGRGSEFRVFFPRRIEKPSEAS